MNITAPLPEPDKQELRKFAFIMAGMISLFFGVLVPWLWSLGLLAWPWIVAAVFTVWGAVWPRGLRPVHWLWMRFGLVIGWVNSRIILGAVFYLMFTPIGLAMRLFGHDPMRRKLDAQQPSYRINAVSAPPEHMQRPY